MTVPTSPSGDVEDHHLRATFERSIDDGRVRLHRPLHSLVATGIVGGFDVGTGVLAYLVVLTRTHDSLLAALAFSVGFIALTLAQSELFTENFLVPVTTVVARDARPRSLTRLWVVTGVANLAGGWIIVALVMVAVPDLAPAARATGAHYPAMGIGAEAFAAGILGGAAMTLLTWMERGTSSVGAKLVAAVAVAFVLTAPPLDHAIVSSLEMFAALRSGAPFGYADWLGAASWAALANLVGGLGLVTTLRLVQIGKRAMDEEIERAPDEPRPAPAAPVDEL